MHSKASQRNILSLCSGGGGLELGLRLALPSSRTVCYVEREAYACSILEARMQDGSLDEAAIWDDISTFDGKPWNGAVDIVSAGWPCQPFSHMGKRKGVSDNRYLWPCIARIVSECRPNIFFGENVAPHVDAGFSGVCSELREMGYSCEAGLFTAAEMGFSHKRKRLFVLAYASGQYADNWQYEQIFRESLGGCLGRLDASPKEAMEDPGKAPYPPSREEFEDWRRIFIDHPSYKPAFFTLADELAAGMGKSKPADREKQIRTLGNGVVPACAAYAFCILLGRAFGAI